MSCRREATLTILYVWINISNNVACTQYLARSIVIHNLLIIFILLIFVKKLYVTNRFVNLLTIFMLLIFISSY